MRRLSEGDVRWDLEDGEARTQGEKKGAGTTWERGQLEQRRRQDTSETAMHSKRRTLQFNPQPQLPPFNILLSGFGVWWVCHREKAVEEILGKIITSRGQNRVT